VILKVTPFITPDNMVEMIVSPQISSIDSSTSIPISATANAPVINVRSADTVAVTPDGQTVIIGGLMSDTKAANETKIPVLGDIPLLGNLFKRKQKTGTKTELLIFLTPHIVMAPSELAALSDRERQKSNSRDSFTEEELNRFLETLPTKNPAQDDSKKRSKD
jgi:general secretion pathway protein D